MTASRVTRRNKAKLEREVRRVKREQASKSLNMVLKESFAQQRASRLGHLAKLTAAATDPWLMQRAAALPEKGERTPGRPTLYPNWVMVLFGQAVSIYGSALAVDVEFSNSDIWDLVVNAIGQVHGDDMVKTLPDVGPSVNQWNHYLRKSKARGWDVLLRNANRRAAAAQARAMGMFNPKDYFRVTDPRREYTITFDGKVSTSPSKYKQGDTYVDKVTGEIKTRKADTNTKLWPEAGTKPIPGGTDAATANQLRNKPGNRFEWGVKATYAWARLPQSGTRILLDVDTMQPDNGDEGASIVEMTHTLHEMLPGIQSVVTDGVLHHKHINPLMRRGLLICNKQTQAPRNGRNAVRIGDRFEKSHHIETVEIEHGSRTCRHRLYGIGGDVYEQSINDSGEQTFTLLDGRTIRRARKGYTDWYRSVTIKCRRCGGKTAHNIPLTEQDEDAFKRSEYLRQLPMTDENFRRMYGFRPDSESGNNRIEQAFYLNRMPAYGHHNQSVLLLMHAGQINAEAWHIHTSRLIDNGLLGVPDDPLAA